MKNSLCELKTSYATFKATSFVEKTRAIAFVLFFLCILDCSISGGGHYFTIGSLTPRILLGFLSLLFCIPALIVNFRQYLHNKLLWLFAAFLVCMVVNLFRGYWANNLTSVIISDLKGFMWLFLVLVAVVTVDTKTRFEKIATCILLGGVLQACFIIFVNFASICLPGYFMFFYNTLIEKLLGSITRVSDNMFRIFMKSCPYMVTACSIAVYRQAQAKKLRFSYIAVITLCFTACVLSFTRSLYGSLGIAAIMTIVLLFVLYRKQVKKHLIFLATTFVCIFLSLSILQTTLHGPYVRFALFRTLGFDIVATLQEAFTPGETVDPDFTTPEDPEDPTKPDETPDIEQMKNYMTHTVESDSIRAKTQRELFSIIKKHPVFGTGLGAVAPSRGGPDEYFYLNVTAKMGIVGLLLYLAPFGMIVIYSWKNRKNLKQIPSATGVLCGMLGFWVITWFNPWMNSSLGISAYAICSTIPQLLNCSNQKD